MNAWEKFKKNIEKAELVSAGDKILLAVSGGPDSVSLLHLFWRLKKNVPIELSVVHMDHGLRKSSKKELKFVEDLSDRFGLPVITQKLPVEEFAEINKISLETAGRNLRYEVLSETAKKLGFNKIATGHTADDNAETVIMWMIRGTGTDGLAGIPLSRKIRAGLEIIRPLLSITKEEIFKYLKSQRISYCIDKSNFKLDFTRNRIRHEILGKLKKYNKKTIEHLYNLSKIVALENEFLNVFTDKALKKSAKFGIDKNSLDLNEFFRYNKPIQYRILKRILPEKISLLNIEKVFDFLSNSKKDHMALSETWKVRKNNQKSYFFKVQ